MLRRALTTAALAISLAACGSGSDAGETAAASGAMPRVGAFPRGGAVDDSLLPPPAPRTTNPLGLPARDLPLEVGTRVFAVPEEMLSRAQVGSSFTLRRARVEGMDGRDVVVRIGYGRAYPIHPDYLVVPKPAARVRNGTLVISSYRGSLHHGIVRQMLHRQLVVRFTDAGPYIGDLKLERDAVGVLSGGLEPGAYALHRTEGELRHVLLVSASTHEDGVKRWLALGALGEAQLIPEGELEAMAHAHRLDAGTPVLVAWRGRMVPATVKSVERPGLFTVVRPSLDRQRVVGPDMLLPLPKEARR